MTIEEDIKRVFKNWIRQEPGAYRFIVIDADIIDSRERHVGIVH